MAQANRVANIAILIHGMTPDQEISDPREVFATFWKNVVSQSPLVKKNFPSHHVVLVTWGHQIKKEEGRIQQDQRLTRAQLRISDRVKYENVRRHRSPNNVVMSGIGTDFPIPGLRGILMKLRETIVTFGLADVVYYCSSEGEKEVRRVVYGQVLKSLNNFKDSGASEIRLHVIGHSLGVTISHDFLFGLFKKGHNPDFNEEDQGEEQDRELYLYWRDRAQSGSLTLGSFTSMASQLPLFVMRKHSMIDTFFDGHGLNLNDIGVDDGTNRSEVKWGIFYDIDDVLGFASRDLYDDPHNLVRQIQVNTGFDDRAHTDYLTNSTVIRETARLIEANCE